MTPVRLTLKKARVRAGLSQQALAELVGVRQATISDLENGRSQRIDFELLDRLCAELKVEPGALLIRERTRKT